MLTNRHPADELADLRAQIRELEAREQELRARLLIPGADLSGAEWRALVVTQSRDRLDAAALRQQFGAAALKPFMRSIKVTMIERMSMKPADSSTIERTFNLPHGYAATFVWPPQSPGMLAVKWAPDVPCIRKPESRQEFFEAYVAARRSFYTEVAALTGGSVLVADTNGRMEVVEPPTRQ
jgi:hypothetical protein